MDELQQLPIPLLVWYGEHARKLPWRENPTPYRVWLSEVMLQQTRVAAVVDYYTRFLAAAPTVEALAGLEEDELMKLWQGLGYYSRARNLHKAARQILERHGGVFPDNYADIRALAGVGDYTAGAISSIAFGLPTPAVDGNVLRVVSRICADEGDILSPATRKRCTQALAEIIPLKAPGDFNQALMELGATVCLPNGAPLCEKCPARDFCRAHLENKTHLFPVKSPKKGRKVENRTVYLLFFEDKVALRRRGSTGLLAGLWEFPNELLPGEVPERSEGGEGCTFALSVTACGGSSSPGGRAKQEPPGEQHLPLPLGEVALTRVSAGRHIFSHIEWHMTALAGEVSSHLPEGWVWADRRDLRDKYALPSAFDFVKEAVEGRIGRF